MFDFVKFPGEDWMKAHLLSYKYAFTQSHWGFVRDRDGLHVPTDESKYLYAHFTTDIGITSTNWMDSPFYNTHFMAPFSLKPNFFNGHLEEGSLFSSFKVISICAFFF